MSKVEIQSSRPLSTNFRLRVSWNHSQAGFVGNPGRASALAFLLAWILETPALGDSGADELNMRTGPSSLTNPNEGEYHLQFVRREDLEQVPLPGRTIQKVVGKDGFMRSTRMTMGFARHSGGGEHREPHHHAEEAAYILSARDGRVRYGPSPDRLGPPVVIEAGMILHFPELEWHVFDIGPGGHVDAVFFYGQVDNIRPEEIIGTKDISRA